MKNETISVPLTSLCEQIHEGARFLLVICRQFDTKPEVFGAYHTARDANNAAKAHLQGVAFAIINIRKIVGAVYVNA